MWLRNREPSDNCIDSMLIIGIIVILILKLTGVINISWTILLIPIWILLALMIGFMLVIFGGLTINYINKRRKENERN